jgi:hypothetical protein
MESAGFAEVEFFSMRSKRLAAPVTDAQNENRAAFDRKQDPILVRLATIDQLPHLERDGIIFPRQHATVR